MHWQHETRPVRMATLSERREENSKAVLITTGGEWGRYILTTSNGQGYSYTVLVVQNKNDRIV